MNIRNCFRKIEFLSISTESNVVQLAKRNFDAAVFEIIISIGNGATLILMDEDSTLYTDRFIEFVEEYSVTRSVFN